MVLGSYCKFGAMKEKPIKHSGFATTAYQSICRSSRAHVRQNKRLISQHEAVKEQQMLKRPVKEDTSLSTVAKMVPRRKLPVITSAMKKKLLVN